MKLLKTSDELISHMKIKGIKFDIAKEEDAKVFLQNNNYYMKLASYRANYAIASPILISKLPISVLS